MARITVLIHLPNEEPIVGEIERMPEPQDTILILENPRRKTGKDVHYLEADVTKVIIPWSRVTLVEVLPTEEEEIIGFVRDDL
ncbi:MAG: hypothetical protein GXO36_05060 [Chloroflexi bacterium]|nr:hypothetical protein [Chloroflexota bacterium]